MTSGKGKSIDTVKRLVVSRGFKGAVGVGRMSRQSIEDFWGSENTLYDTIMVNTCHYTFAQSHRMYTKSKL